jgi:hypothetical protein
MKKTKSKIKMHANIKKYLVILVGIVVLLRIKGLLIDEVFLTIS